MLDDVIKRLDSFGYTVTDSDTWVLGFLIDKVTSSILSDCNLPALPAALLSVVVDMVAGEFLLGKKGSAEGLPGFDLEAAEKSIQEGDTNITFGDGEQSPEQRLDTMISWLLAPRQDFSSYRKLRW